MPRWLAVIVALYLLMLASVTFGDLAGPERWWWSSLNEYLPQWIWLGPGLLALLLTLIKARRSAWIPVLGLLFTAGPLMGWRWRLFTPAAHGTTLRIMTYNVKWGYRDGRALARAVVEAHPDILQMQDSDGVLKGDLGRVLAGWNIRTSGQFIVASRLPLPDLESRDVSYADSNHHVVRYTVQLGGSVVVIYTAHLLSPRMGLVSVRHRHISGLEWNTQARLVEADRLAGYLRAERLPTILTGDLNAPVQSLVCRKLFGAGLRDAFSAAGRGYGYSYGGYTPLKMPYIRIDHILVSHQWKVLTCQVGSNKGSDHCPVMAELELRG